MIFVPKRLRAATVPEDRDPQHVAMRGGFWKGAGGKKSGWAMPTFARSL
jgi:hypothetical protein